MITPKVLQLLVVFLGSLIRFGTVLLQNVGSQKMKRKGAAVPIVLNENYQKSKNSTNSSTGSVHLFIYKPISIKTFYG